MPAIKDLKLTEGDKDNIIALNKEMIKLQTKITLHIKDGEMFPALMEINRLKTLEDPTGSGAYKDLARSQAKVKSDEVSRLISELEASCANLAAEVLMAGEDLNSKTTLDEVVNEIEATKALYVGKARKALVHLAEASGGSPAPPPAVYGPPPAPTPRPEVNRWIRISATAEPSTLPRDISPSDFHLWMLKFTTFSNAS